MSRPDKGFVEWSGVIPVTQQSMEFLPHEPYVLLTESFTTREIGFRIAAGPKGSYDRASMSCVEIPYLNDNPAAGPDPKRVVIVDKYGLGRFLWIDDPAREALHRFWGEQNVNAHYWNSMIKDTDRVGVATVELGQGGCLLDDVEYSITPQMLVVGSLITAVRRTIWQRGFTDTINEQYAIATQRAQPAIEDPNLGASDAGV